MQLPLGEIFVSTLKGFGNFSDLWVLIAGIFLFLVILNLVGDLLNRESRIRWFLHKKKIKDLRNLSPTEFEEYTGELFRALGYRTKVVGGRSDGGIDVIAEQEGVSHYIQCKKYITRKVSVGDIRDFYGAITDNLKGGKGYFVTTNTFTPEAEKFAANKPLILVDKFELVKLVKQANINILDENTECPKCSGKLVKRKGKYGLFFGCKNYPSCTYTAHIPD